MVKNKKGQDMALTVGEIKRLLKDVPDDFEAIIELEDMDVVDIEVNYKEKTVSFEY